MNEDFLVINLEKYPKLKKLEQDDSLLSSRFLRNIKDRMHKGILSYNQAVAACTIIDEKSRNSVQGKR